jgi:hypothetical protein
MLLQMPILFALFRTFSVAVGTSPEALIEVSKRVYPWSFLQDAMPLPAEFLWLHLGQPDKLVLPILVAATTYVMQKMTMLPATDERQQAQNSMMNMMMPLIFGWITITMPSGLGLYYALSNVIGAMMQYFYIGGGPFNWRALLGLSSEPVLPRALEVRQAQLETVRRIAPASDEPEEPAGAGGARVNRRPRRIANGRRRGRR